MSFALDVCKGLNECGIATTGPRPKVAPRAEYEAHINGERRYYMTLDNERDEAVILSQDRELFVTCRGVPAGMIVRLILRHARGAGAGV